MDLDELTRIQKTVTAIDEANKAARANGYDNYQIMIEDIISGEATVMPTEQRLVQAAPDLLAACKALRALVDTIVTRPDITVTMGEIAARIAEADAAIHKAERGQ